MMKKLPHSKVTKAMLDSPIEDLIEEYGIRLD
jgi:hypothetical protein